jgi:hypothetical protein
MLDVAGHYARPDVFELIVHREAHPMIRVAEDRDAGIALSDSHPHPGPPPSRGRVSRGKKRKI